MVNNTNSPLWKMWQKFVFSDLPPKSEGKPLPPGWLKKKGKEWQLLKESGAINFKKLSIKKKRKCKPGRKRGRRKGSKNKVKAVVGTAQSD